MVAPLAGMKVIDLGTMITAPLAAMMLGDLGAEVIKVEREDGGDPFRSFNGSLYSPHFVAFNRNKTSMQLDLQSDAGREALLQLVETADVAIDNFRPGVLGRLNLDTAILQARNPRLVHCSITGFGETGPYRERPAYDTVGQALSGIAHLQIDPDRPRLSGTTISDNVTGMYACYGVLAALMERYVTNKGRRIEVNMLEASIAFMPDAFMNLEQLGVSNDPYTRVSFSQAFVMRCKDGKRLALHLSSPDKFWRALVDVLAAPELSSDDRFVTRKGRIANYLALADELRLRFENADREEWMTKLAAKDVPFAPVHRTEDVFADPQQEAMKILRTMTLADGTEARCIQAPLLFDGKRMDAWSPAPLFKVADEGSAPPRCLIGSQLTCLSKTGR
jgi:crotonobetainyl-CoA:carnitine CoA-transferase CaiB-like acyl-CoA transferase